MAQWLKALAMQALESEFRFPEAIYHMVEHVYKPYMPPVKLEAERQETSPSTAPGPSTWSTWCNSKQEESSCLKQNGK